MKYPFSGGGELGGSGDVVSGPFDEVLIALCEAALEGGGLPLVARGVEGGSLGVRVAGAPPGGIPGGPLEGGPLGQLLRGAHLGGVIGGLLLVAGDGRPLDGAPLIGSPLEGVDVGPLGVRIALAGGPPPGAPPGGPLGGPLGGGADLGGVIGGPFLGGGLNDASGGGGPDEGGPRSVCGPDS